MIKPRNEHDSLHQEAVYLLRLAGKVIEQECGSGGSALATAISEFFKDYDDPGPLLIVSTPPQSFSIDDIEV